MLEGAEGPAPAARAGLKLTPEPGRVVTYMVREKSVDRDESLGGKRVRHESYVLPRSQTRFAIGTEAGWAMVSLLIEPGPASASGDSARARNACLGGQASWRAE